MKNKVFFGPLVKSDLKEITDWYGKINQDLSSRFITEFRTKINFIAENPFSSEVKYDEIRIAFLKKFPVAIHYSIPENRNEIIVYAVFHTSRNPDIWKVRK